MLFRSKALMCALKMWYSATAEHYLLPGAPRLGSMTQPVAVPILGQDEPAGQPFGFASPQVFPLSAAEPRTQPTPSGGPAPDDFAPPQTATVPLESIGPTPEPPRNPTEPYLGDAPPPTNTTWRPDQPFTTLNAMPAAPQPSVDPTVLPPPSGPSKIGRASCRERV